MRREGGLTGRVPANFDGLEGLTPATHGCAAGCGITRGELRWLRWKLMVEAEFLGTRMDVRKGLTEGS